MWCVSISPHVLCLALLVWSRLHGLRLIHFLPHEPWEFCFPRTVFAAALRISTMWLSSEISLSKAFALWSSSRLGFVIVSVVTDVLVTGCLPHEPCVNYSHKDSLWCSKGCVSYWCMVSSSTAAATRGSFCLPSQSWCVELLVRCLSSQSTFGASSSQ